jgi:predicted dehydrogenase
MKQILQNLRTGATTIADIPCPAMRRGDVLVRTRQSLISAGTERMLVEFGRAGWIGKARQQPEKVRTVLSKLRTDGIVQTVEAVANQLDRQIPLGYSNVGIVLDIGDDVAGITVGDRVVSNGSHAEVVSVPMNLCVRVPDAVSDEDAVFSLVAAIGLQGIRLAQPTMGESVVVIGLGLIGLLTVQLLRAHGCRVLGIDFDQERLALARRFGADVVDLSDDPLRAADEFSRGRGVDAVLITAATHSNEPVHQAAVMCRKRGRIILVGVAGLELSRADFYEKELSFQVSCSYGPGRYDAEYEEKGHDYPFGFVRWTEQRNIEAVLDMMADGRLDPAPLVSHRIPIGEAEQAYAIVAGAVPSLGIVLQYPTSAEKSDRELSSRRVVLRPPPDGAPHDEAPNSAERRVRVSFIGSGKYATAVLIPAFTRAGARPKSVASRSGISGVLAARKFGFSEATTEIESVLSDADTDAVVITTRHDSHAALVVRALESGKHVFVEKPLALTAAQLEDVRRARAAAVSRGNGPLVMVGFNRRFAPHTVKMRSLLAGVRGRKALIMTVNAGALPQDHWTRDPDVGGGRIVGEACHFIDLLRFLVGVPIVDFDAQALTSVDGTTGDDAVITLRFEDGSVGTLSYLTNGHKSFPKERLEVFVDGRILQLDNFRRLTGFGWRNFRRLNLWRQDKGQRACAAAFIGALATGGPPPIDFDELLEVSRTSIAVAHMVAHGR